MTKKEFKDAMMRGLGRCILELENTENVEKYREIVLWGCVHNLSYDTQCEGTKAWYIRELIRRFHDEEPFVTVAARKLSECRCNGGWAFSHYCELLALFAQEGNEQAFAALQEKYAELFEVLKTAKKRRKNGTFPECDDLEILCIELIDSAANPAASYLKIAEDIGRLLSENTGVEFHSFDYLFAHCEQTYGKNRVRKLVAQKAQFSPPVKRYLDEMLMNDKIPKEGYCPSVPQTTEEILKMFDEERKREQVSGRLARISSLKIRGWIKRSGNAEVLSILAQRYLAEQDSMERARLLRVFGRSCPFPISPEPVIQDARHGDAVLREAAFFVLDYIHHEKARQFALELASEGEYISEAVSLLANNYRKEDRELLVRLVKTIPVTYDDKTGWHGAYSSVLDLLKKKGIESPPKEILSYLYEHTLCSVCREYILKEMGRRRMVTEELLRECLYDSNYEIRRYAEGRLV